MLELYCGIGGCAAALGDRAEVVQAIDISEVALAAYRKNFPHPTQTANLESLSLSSLERLEADLWWLSPPCQPFTQRGHQRDLDDPRAKTFVALLERIAAVRPPWIAMENVAAFSGSRAHGRLLDTLESAGYGALHEDILCPSEMGTPNRRRRFYLVAAQKDLAPAVPCSRSGFELASVLESAPAPELMLDNSTASRYRQAIHVVDPSDPAAVTNCFTAAYGRSPVRSGSYLATPDGPRRFSPREILRLFDFPIDYRLPPGLPRKKAWQLVGNSLSLPPVRAILGRVPGLGTLSR